MRPETKRRFVVVFGNAVRGSVVMLAMCSDVVACVERVRSGERCAADDGSERASAQWATSDPLKDGNWQPETMDAPRRPAGKVAPMGDTGVGTQPAAAGGRDQGVSPVGEVCRLGRLFVRGAASAEGAAGRSEICRGAQQSGGELLASSRAIRMRLGSLRRRSRWMKRWWRRTGI